MEKLRNVLIISLLVTAYLLVLQWNEDYGQPEQSYQSPPSSEGQDQELISESGAQSPELTFTQQESSELQTLETPEDVSYSSAVETSETADHDLIKVETDVLTLKIDPATGTVVESRLLQYPTSLNSSDPLTLLINNPYRVFTAKTALQGRDGIAFGKETEGPRLNSDRTAYQLSDAEDELSFELKFENEEVIYRKRFSLKRGDYKILVEDIVENKSGNDWRGNFTALIRRDRSPDPTTSGGFGAMSFLGGVLSSEEDVYQKLSFDDMDDERFKVQSRNGWVAFVQHYFVTAWVPKNESGRILQARRSGRDYVIGFAEETVTIPPGQSHTFSSLLYTGPKVMERLNEVAPHLDKTVDFGILWFIASPLFWVLEFIQDWVGNWGIAIILLTVLIKALFFRLSAASYRSMAKMRKVAPELTRLRETYGDDRQKMSQAMMELYRKEKINPLGGCLPILVQMPVFIALYWVLLESVELRQAPFFGWIQDLSLKDPYFVLPLLMGASMFVQMKLNPTPPDPVQARVMQLMPVFFTIFFLWFPAGLVLYWLVNNLLSIAQQWVITRKIEQEA